MYKRQIYADKEDNIFYVSNAKLAVRDSSYDWTKTLPGNTSKTLTDSYHVFDDLPQLFNPSSGYIFNTNNSPFNCSSVDDNPKEEDYNKTFSFREKVNNRSLRFEELIKNQEKVSYQEFLDIKYDQQYPKTIFCPFEINDIFKFNSSKYPIVKDLIDIIQNWDRKANIKSRGAAQWFIYYRNLDQIVTKSKMDLNTKIPEKFILSALEKTNEYFMKNFGGLDVLFEDFQKHVRGDVELAVPGLVDMIGAISTKNYKEGMVKAVSGESYIMLVRYSKSGMEIETVLPYGSSNRSDSPHYTDQMSLYVNHQRKKMTLDKEIIYNNSKKIYHPQ